MSAAIEGDFDHATACAAYPAVDMKHARTNATAGPTRTLPTHAVRRLGPLVCAAVLSFGSPAAADADGPEERATKLFDKGRALARDGHCAEAVPVFLESLREAAGIGPMLNLGNCYEVLGKTATAHRQFKRAEETAVTRGDPRSVEAHARAEALAPTLSTITVSIVDKSEQDLVLRLDDERLPPEQWAVAIPVDPGTHVLEASSPRRGRTLQSVVVRAGADRAALVVPALVAPPPRETPARDDPKPGSLQRTIGYGLAGAGGVGVVVGSVFGILSIAKHSSVVDQCPAYPTCDASARSAIDDDNGSARTFGNISTVSFVVGGALLLGGVLLVLTAPRARHDTIGARPFEIQFR